LTRIRSKINNSATKGPADLPKSELESTIDQKNALEYDLT
jgi:hypothetical protein